MITFIPANATNKIKALFSGWDKTMIYSCLQGHMGHAWADDADSPTAAQIIVGDVCFLAGDASSPAAKALIGNVPDSFSRPSMLMIPRDDSWHERIEEVYQGRFKKELRYAFQKEPDIFDRALLHSCIDALPGGYQIHSIDEPLYLWTQTEEWAEDFCSQFSSYADYQKRGLGYLVLHEGKPVCGASSYTVYDGGLEIQIETAQAHRRKGLASACAARLIIECLEKGLYPSWDAANPESAALAEKLGYHLDRAYAAYEVTV